MLSNITHIAQANIAIFKSVWLFEFIFVNSIKYQGHDAWTLWKGINGQSTNGVQRSLAHLGSLVNLIMCFDWARPLLTYAAYYKRPFPKWEAIPNGLIFLTELYAPDSLTPSV